MRARDHGRLSNTVTHRRPPPDEAGRGGGASMGVRVVVARTDWYLVDCRVANVAELWGVYGARARARTATLRGRLNESRGCQKDENIPYAMWILVLGFVFGWSTSMGVRWWFGSFDGLLLSGCFVMDCGGKFWFCYRNSETSIGVCSIYVYAWCSFYAVPK